MKKKWIVLLTIAILLLVFAFSFRVTSVTVEGNTLYSDEEVEKMLCSDIFDKNTITAYVREYFSVKKTIPFIREYKVSFPGIRQVHIKLYEKAIVAGIEYMNEYIYFDKEGLILEINRNKREDTPLFEVKGVTNFTINEKIGINNDILLEQILKISNMLANYSIKADRILFNSKDETIIYSDKVKINLGKRDEYDDAIAALQSVLPTALEKKLSGEIDLTSYKVGDDIIFKKN